MLYNSESEFLYLRLHALGPYINHVILGVSNMTLSGNFNQPYTFFPFEEEIFPYRSRIHIYYSDYYIGDPRFFNETDKEKRAWIIEPQRRKDLELYIDSLHPKETDLILQCDVDEILFPRIMEWVITNPPKTYYRFECELFTYSFRWKNPQYWGMPTVFRYGSNPHDLQAYRNTTSDGLLQGYFSCVHCTSCFRNPVQLSTKFQSYAHTQYGKPPFTEEGFLYARLMCHVVPFLDLKLHLFNWEENYSQEFNFPQNPKLQFLFEENPWEIWFKNASSSTKFQALEQYAQCIKANPEGVFKDSYNGPLAVGNRIRVSF